MSVIPVKRLMVIGRAWDGILSLVTQVVVLFLFAVVFQVNSCSMLNPRNRKLRKHGELPTFYVPGSCPKISPEIQTTNSKQPDTPPKFYDSGASTNMFSQHTEGGCSKNKKSLCDANYIIPSLQFMIVMTSWPKRSNDSVTQTCPSSRDLVSVQII